MRRRTLLAACGTCLAGLAGCSSNADDSGGTTPTGTPTSTDTPDGSTPTGTPPSTPTPTKTPTETPTETPDPATVVDYGALSSTQREAFERAQSQPIRFSTGVPGLDKKIHYGLSAVVPFRNHRYVRKDGTYYELTLERSGLIGGTRVEVEPVESADSESVVHLGEMNGDGVDLVVTAIETGGDAARIRVDGPDAITTGTVVEYEGSYYRVTQVSTRDYEYFTLTVEKRS